MKKKSYKKENHTHTDMHNGKRNNNKNNYYYTIETNKLLQQQQTTRVKAPITKKKSRKPHCERSIIASGSRLPSNRVQQSVLFRFESSYSPKS